MRFLLPFLIFLPAVFLFFSVPGIYLLTLSKHKFSAWERLFIGTVVGFCIFTLISYLFVVVNLPILIILLVLIVNLFGFKHAFKTVKSIKFPINKEAMILLIVFVVGILGQLAIIAPSGMVRDGDLLFWSSHGHDGTWHIALMEEIKRGGQFKNPVFSGERLVNYHFFSDVAPAIFGKYLGLSNLDLYFRLFPFLHSVLLGASVYLLAKRMTKSFGAAIWSVFFTYFAGSFGYIVTYLKNGTIGGESIFWATQIQSSSGNPPQIVSNFLVLAELLFIYLLLQKRDKALFFLSVIMVGSLTLFKVYAAVVILLPIAVVGVWQILRSRNVYLLSLGVLAGVLGAVLWLPNTSSSTGFLIYEPWWYIRTMIVEPSRLDWLDHELRRQTYIYENNWKRVMWLEGIAFLIFLLGNLGTRVIGFWDFAKFVKSIRKNDFNLLFIGVVVLSFALPLVFLQKGVASNTSQFLQYFILLWGILAAISVNRIINLIKIRPVKVVVALVIVILSIPTQVGLLREFYSRDAYARISRQELLALEYMKNDLGMQEVVILTSPYDQYFSLGDAIPNIWDWYETSYVAAFSGQRLYFDDREQVDIMGYDFQKRKDIKEMIFRGTDLLVVKDKIKETKANLVYFPKPLSPKVNLISVGLHKVYENEEVEIWSVPFN